MALSDDQRAMLRLLAQREEGYEDIAALKGLSVEEVRAEVKAALEQLAADEKAAGEAPPAAPAPVEQQPPVEPPQPPRSQSKPEETANPSPVAVPPAQSKPTVRRSRPSVPPERRRLLVLAGGALGLVALVLIAVAVFSDSEDSSSTGGTQALSESAVAENAKVTKAVLEPVNGGDGEGLALFGRIRKDVVLQVAAQGLEPAPKGQAYVLWLASSPEQMVPVTPVEVSEAGEVAVQYPIPAEALAFLARGVFDEIDISLVSAATYKAAFAKARKDGGQPSYTGTDVLRGKITGPIVGALASQKNAR